MPLSSCAFLPSLASLGQNSQIRRIPCSKSFPLWHMMIVLLISSYYSGTCSPMVVAIATQRLSGACPLVWPAALTECFFFFCKGSGGGTCHVLHGAYHSMIVPIVFLPFRRVKWCLALPNWTSCSYSMCQNACNCIPNHINFVFLTGHCGRPNDKRLCHSIDA